MKAVNHFIIKVDEHFWKKQGEIFTPKEGNEFQIIPNHGEVIQTLDKCDIKVGDTVHFHHWAISNKMRSRGELFVFASPRQIIAFESEGELRGFTRIIVNRVESEAYLNNEKAIIKMPFIPQYKEQCYQVLHDPTNTHNRGDIIWAYSKANYHLQQLPEHFFIEPQYVVCNQTKDTMVADWSLVKYLDKNEDYINKNGILLMDKTTQLKNSVEVVKSNQFPVGGRFIINRSSMNAIPMIENGGVIKHRDFKCSI